MNIGPTYLLKYFYHYSTGRKTHLMIIAHPFTGDLLTSEISLEEASKLQEICQELTTEEGYFHSFQIENSYDAYIYYINEESTEDIQLREYFHEIFKTPIYQARIKKALKEEYRTYTDNFGVRETLPEDFIQELEEILREHTQQFIKQDNSVVYTDIKTPEDTYEQITLKIRIRELDLAEEFEKNY